MKIEKCPRDCHKTLQKSRFHIAGVISPIAFDNAATWMLRSINVLTSAELTHNIYDFHNSNWLEFRTQIF